MLSVAYFNGHVSLRALCKEGCLKEVLRILLTANNPPVHSSTCIHILHASFAGKTLSKGKQIHSYINDSKFTFATNPVLQNTLINMYDKCGSLVDARRAFDNMSEPDVLSWNMIIAAYRRHGLIQQALTLFHKMQRTDIQPDHFTFSTILPVCANPASLNHGLEIHGKIIRCGCQSDVIVTNTLIDMYAKCQRVETAHELFDKMPDRDVVSWTAILAGYARNGLFEKALQSFKQMQLAGVKPNSATFATMLPACSKIGDLEQGIEIHQVIVESGFSSDVVVSNALIDMYAKCGIIQKSRAVFDKMHNADVVSWTAMITGYTQSGVLDEALMLFEEMPQRNVVSWTAIIGGYAQNGFVDKSFEIFEQMQSSGVKPNSATFASILPAFAKVGDLQHGMEVHQKIVESGLLSDATAVTTLIDFYAKRGSIDKAHELFDNMSERNVVSSTAIVAGYAQNGLVEQALEIFKEMLSAGVKPNSATLATILPVCAKMRSLEYGMEIHQIIIECEFLSHVVVVTSLIDMYAKCGSIHKSRKLFEKIPQRDVASWTAIIAGYAQIGLVEEALEILKQMQLAGIKPNSSVFASILSACVKHGVMEIGMEIHRRTIESGYSTDVVIATSLIDMYANFGYVNKACKLFEEMPERNLASWNAMI
ncbi:pentatricopeptide repeat-containing protein At3g53360, mitochondrial-like [Cryptomeria japonica]|uniref:pentatricopeptide repeat-containing protein At3g53360, mitochondrial-like n=1 Tax=Cryptomeria japonica TaxID=3369 RepID=UPI0027DA51A8|nr:pentatricopeptide repeat-containing protein At3g53360, mitochondrial-like [Cryptomeria japonica]